MLRPISRFGILLAMTLYFIFSPYIMFHTVWGMVTERSMNRPKVGFSNTLEKKIKLIHPHEVPGKPSKFDLDLSEYMEICSKDPLRDRILESSTLKNSLKEAQQFKKEIATIVNTSEQNGEQSGMDMFKCLNQTISVRCINGFKNFLSTIFKVKTVPETESVKIMKKKNINLKDSLRKLKSLNNISLMNKIDRLTHNNIINMKLRSNLLSSGNSRTFFSGVTSFAQSSQNPAQSLEENYEFKDNQGVYNNDYMMHQPLGTLPASAMYEENMLQAKLPEIESRYSLVDPRLTSMNTLSDRYYTRHVLNPQSKKQDFKVFHEIPTSSLLLTNYDPFYSPLLSRLDAVFSRLGHNSEGCREYAVCAMYRSPARYAPYSNLVSAQLSRELNDLRKPNSDNPDILRFFRYMKAAKDGQDGLHCENMYENCASARDDQTIKQNQAMLATYQDIDKLVHARKF